MIRIKACDDAAVCGARGRARVLRLRLGSSYRILGSTAERGRHLLSVRQGGGVRKDRREGGRWVGGGGEGGVYVVYV